MVVDRILIFNMSMRLSERLKRDGDGDREWASEAKQKVNTECIHGENGCKSLVNHNILWMLRFSNNVGR